MFAKWVKNIFKLKFAHDDDSLGAKIAEHPNQLKAWLQCKNEINTSQGILYNTFFSVDLLVLPLNVNEI